MKVSFGLGVRNGGQTECLPQLKIFLLKIKYCVGFTKPFWVPPGELFCLFLVIFALNTLPSYSPPNSDSLFVHLSCLTSLKIIS